MGLLEVDGAATGYGRVEVLHDVTLDVPAGQVVAVLGPNGVGKSTLLRMLSGTLPAWRGQVRLDGARIERRTPYEIARRGMLLVPEGRGVFPGLTVRENLTIAAHAARGRDASWRDAKLAELLARFPRLEERRDQRAGTLSGGEQQMLALARAFVGDPRILLLDEISMGLAPIIVEELFAAVADLRAAGLTIVLVEQYLTYALRYADHCYVLSKGRVSFSGSPTELDTESALAGSYLGV